MPLDLSRTENLIGKSACELLKNSHAAVFGIGGVGGYVCEALARSGVGRLTLIDADRVAPSNTNRQIIAAEDTVGMYKTEAMRRRIHSYSPECKIDEINMFYLPENADSIDFSGFDIAADCVDTVSAKLEIICRAQKAGIPVISSMGAGNKLHPERFRIDDIYKTSVDPLARAMRRVLKERGVKSLPVVWSDEPPIPSDAEPDPESGKIPPGSIAFVPSAAGLILAGWIVRRLTGIEK